MSQADQDRTPAAQSALHVSAIWHEQVHQSRVTSIAVSPDGRTVYCGCDAAAPKREEALEPPVVALEAANGKRLRSYDAEPPMNVRRLLPSFPDGSQLLCIASDARLLTFDADAAAAPPHEAVLPGALAPGAPPTPDPAAAHPPEQPPSEPASAPRAGPQFLAQSGYRGPREGYLFRQGSLGCGYYRKDVVRRYAGAATAPAPPSPASERLGARPGEGAPAADGVREYLQRAAKAPPGLRCVALSADGGLLFTPSPDADSGDVLVWRVQRGGRGGVSVERVAGLSGHSAGVLALVASPDSSLLISASYDGTIRVWSAADWACLKVLRGHGGGVRALALSPDGRVLYSAAADNTIRAWSTSQWVCLRTLHGRHEETTWPCCMALHPAAGAPRPAPLLVTASTGPFGASTLKAFRPGDGVCLATFAQLRYDQRGDVSALAFAPDGAVLYSGASDGSVAAWALHWAEPGGGARAGLRRGFL